MSRNRYIEGYQPVIPKVTIRVSMPPGAATPAPPYGGSSAMRAEAAYRNVDSDGSQSVTADVVIDDGAAPRWSGLYNQYGQPLYRQPERVVMGFAPGVKAR